MMKKYILLLLLPVALISCGDGESDDNDTESNNESRATVVVPTVDVPTPSVASADLPEGTFTVLLTGHSEQAIEENKSALDSRNQNEHVLNLVDRFSGFGVTLYFPFDLQPGTYPMSIFIPAHSEGRISATVTTKAAGVFYAQGGVLIVESISENSITGQFSFIATLASSGRTYNAQGAFNAVPIK